MGRAGAKKDRLRIIGGNSNEANDQFLDCLANKFDASDPERSYKSITSIEHRRRLGQFFTPAGVADLMASWACHNRPAEILDPSVGTGVLLRAASARSPASRLTGVEKDPAAYKAAELSFKRADVLSRLVLDDFLTWVGDDEFDAIVANPPYLRHHDLDYPFDIFSVIGRRNHLKFSRLTNSYGLFIVEICRRLKIGGRAAVLVPGEWTNANFGMPIKRFLIEHGLLRSLIYFSHAELIFDDALTTACVLLIEKPRRRGEKTTTVNTYYLESATVLPTLEDIVGATSCVGATARRFNAAHLAAHSKWDFLLKNGIMASEPGYVPLSSLAKTKRGIATGSNDFFHLSESKATEFQISRKHLRPCVGRATDISGCVFTRDDFNRLGKSNRRTLLADFDSRLSVGEISYVRAGEDQGLNRRYLLASRNPWYSMEKRPIAPIWAAVFGRKRLRFIANEANAYNLTTFHCIYPRFTDRETTLALVACLNSRLVQESSKAENRVYGGGLLKFEPRDLLSVRVPNLSVLPKERIADLAEFAIKLDEALRLTNGGDLLNGVLDQLDSRVQAAAKEAATLTLGELREGFPCQGSLALPQA
jgi:adenine-specific DNA-methyltransferase